MLLPVKKIIYNISCHFRVTSFVYSLAFVRWNSPQPLMPSVPNHPTMFAFHISVVFIDFLLYFVRIHYDMRHHKWLTDEFFSLSFEIIQYHCNFVVEVNVYYTSLTIHQMKRQVVFSVENIHLAQIERIGNSLWKHSLSDWPSNHFTCRFFPLSSRLS